MNDSFGDRLKFLRFKLGLTQREIAKKIGLSQVAYLKYETGKAQPKLDVIVKLKNIFKVNLDWLVDGTGHIFRVIDFSENLLNDTDFVNLLNRMRNDPMFRFWVMAAYDDYKTKYPGRFVANNNETKVDYL